jgi:putative ABC transport system permease protein
MLGVIFGVAAVISMVSIGAGAEKEALEELKKFGANSIRVNAIEIEGERLSDAVKKLARGLSIADVQFIRKSCPFVKYIVPEKTEEYRLYCSNKKPLCKIVGVGENFLEASRFEIEKGRFFSKEDWKFSSSFVVIGAGVASDVFGLVNPIGQIVQIEDARLKVIGVMREQGKGRGKLAIKRRDHDRDVYVTLNTMFDRLQKWPVEDRKLYHQISGLWIEVFDGVDLIKARDVIMKMLRRRHREIVDLESQVPLEILQQSQKTQHLFNLVMALIAGISLLVGGIGIMNIMLASVNERTREVGVRRALGASKKDIVIQFLVEASLISVGGGLAGIILGVSLSFGISIYTGWVTVIPLSAVIIAFFVSISVGIVFGSFPAAKAASLDPVKALRYE